jgi:mono/diheme cytochrome c family protein
MTMLRLPAFAAAFLALSTVAAMAVDADNGERLAQRWCAACHVVSPDQRRANTDAPPFSTIARKPGFNASQVAFFLLVPHPRMPDMNLSRAEAADLAAYIAKQR